MADEFGVRISGIEEACAMLDRVPPETAKLGIARGLAAAAVPIGDALDVRTPIGTGKTAGKLKAARKTDIYLYEDGKGGTASVHFGDQGHVANWVEYGHRMIGHEPNLKELGDVAPKPFMRPAAAESGDAAIEAFTDALGEALVTGTTWADVATAGDEAA